MSAEPYQVLFKFDRIDTPSGIVVWLWGIEHGKATFVARDASGNNRAFEQPEYTSPGPIPGDPEHGLELLGCRPDTTKGKGWAAARVVRV